jgi:hypothetical protein
VIWNVCIPPNSAHWSVYRSSAVYIPVRAARNATPPNTRTGFSLLHSAWLRIKACQQQNIGNRLPEFQNCAAYTNLCANNIFNILCLYHPTQELYRRNLIFSIESIIAESTL